MSTETRNRVTKGVSDGGQFAKESKSEAAGVGLSAAPMPQAEYFEQDMERSQRAAESARRVARHARAAYISTAVNEHFGPGAEIVMTKERGSYRIESVSVDGKLHDAAELDDVVGFGGRVEFDQEFGKFDRVNSIGYPDFLNQDTWRVPTRPAEDHVRPGKGLVESVQADDRDELDIRRQLTEMEIYPYRVDFDNAGKVSTWKGSRPCGSREDGLYDAEQGPEQTAAMQNVFDQHSDVTRTSLRWTRPEPGEPVSFKV